MEIKDILFYSINIDINEESAHIIKMSVSKKLDK
jgi:hypothetical protein